MTGTSSGDGDVDYNVGNCNVTVGGALCGLFITDAMKSLYVLLQAVYLLGLHGSVHMNAVILCSELQCNVWDGLRPLVLQHNHFSISA